MFAIVEKMPTFETIITNQMKDQTLNEYDKMIKFCKATLKEHFAMKADPLKVIGLAKEIGMHDLAEEFEQQLKDEKEEQKEIQDNLHPTFSFIKTFSNH